MNAHTWIDVALALVAGLPAIIAACSSLRNGKKIDRHNGELGRQVDKLRSVTKRPSKTGLQ